MVGYSGGADSTCLLHLLHRCGIDVIAAHLHHGMRPEADDEMARCATFCECLDIPFASGRADVPRMADDMGLSIEEAGRHARYGFFDQARFRTECHLIATAHTRSDLAETVLFNLVRGTGLAGLAGIPERRGNLIRPLLFASRQETREYCHEHGLWFHDDPANADIELSRARLRHRVMPDLAAINPAYEEAIARMAGLVSEEDQFLNGAAAAALEQSEVGGDHPLAFLTKDCEIAFSRFKLEGLPPVLFRRAIRLAAEAVGQPLDAHQTKRIEQGVAAESKGSVTAEGGLVVVEWNEDEIAVRQLKPVEPFRYPLTVPGATESDEFGWVLTANAGPGGPNHQVRASLEAVLNPAGLKGALYFRVMEPGDTMQPYGFEGSRKLSDLLAEAGLTLAARRRLPIICDMLGPIWAPGVCLSNRVKLTEERPDALHLRFGPLGSQPNLS